MRVALISDLHAALGALHDVLDDIDRIGVDRILCLGDIVDMGPRPTEVVDLLRARDIDCVRGNHDALDIEPPLPMLAEVEVWNREVLDPEHRQWLATLPLELEVDLAGKTMLCVHGSPRSFDDQVLDRTPAAELRQWWTGREFDVLACGHTHVQLVRRVGDRVVVNAGSTSMPFERAFDGSAPPRVHRFSEYAIVDHADGRLSFDLRQIPFDMQRYERELRESGFPNPDTWLASWLPD